MEEQPSLDSGHTRGRFQGQGVLVTGGAGGIGGMIVHRWIGLSFMEGLGPWLYD